MCQRARDIGRFADRADPEAIATRFWARGDGLTSLVVTGVLPVRALVDHVPPVATALFIGAGDVDQRCRRSVHPGWRTFAASHT